MTFSAERDFALVAQLFLRLPPSSLCAGLLCPQRPYRTHQLRQSKIDYNVSLHHNGPVIQLVGLITPLAHSVYCSLDKQRITTNYPDLLHLPIGANCCVKSNRTINSRHSGLWRIGRFHPVLKPAWLDPLESQGWCRQGCRN